VERLLRGERVTLRPANLGFSEEELRQRYTWSKDQDLQYWTGSIPSAPTFAEFTRTLPQRDWPADGRRRSYAILDPEGQLIGMVSCYGIDWRAGTGELGVYIGERHLWNRGYGTDAIITLLRHLFCDLGFTEIRLNTYESNVRARRSYQKVGFRPVERRRRFNTHAGYYREVRMSIDRSTFLALHGPQLARTIAAFQS
jgi:ribosomal-protein-alanine N-acetyltransferase